MVLRVVVGEGPVFANGKGRKGRTGRQEVPSQRRVTTWPSRPCSSIRISPSRSFVSRIMRCVCYMTSNAISEIRNCTQADRPRRHNLKVSPVTLGFCAHGWDVAFGRLAARRCPQVESQVVALGQQHRPLVAPVDSEEGLPLVNHRRRLPQHLAQPLRLPLVLPLGYVCTYRETC